ncbi:glycine betaine ABC transporter substrate-binding protein [Desulfonatronospira sp. MSAO_Bac3]|uniref:ABC transporter substrate-binding protein n=1 Tax=Desulfonatronospira sp. MSAO_Bac3 TaxID=2293857 RepID=UPI000FF1AC06|nr:glycine betaine ABC transporter substrate-binding protein [Desulfonatronospira sp. MSAO_Bac3]RQD75701.1 MAG: glycine/betaine ABC transporter substrate-binding protein [Desulfonatronospira sp. MSAO_Bac3]
MKMLNKIMLLAVLAILILPGCGSDDTGKGEAKLKLASSAEWTQRSDGLPNFQEHYGFEFPELAVVDLGLAYQAVGEGLAHVGIGDATEGRIVKYDLVVLEDDKAFFPAYNPAPLVRKDILETYPELEKIMQELSSRLDLKTLSMLNKKVSIDNEMPRDAARYFLLQEGLIKKEPPEQKDAGEIVVGGKTFTEALTLGYLTRYLLEDRGYKVVDEIGLGETAVITPALFSGQIDIYWEYTGTGLMNVMGYDEVVTVPRKCYELVKDWYLENHDVVWLDYAPANNTFVLFTSRELHEEHGWEKISDLGEYVSR